MPNITHQLVIEAAPQTVYEAVTSQQGLSAWWIADCDAKPEVGYVNEFRVGEHGANRMKVMALDPPSYVEWECQNDDPPWSGTKLTFEIRGNSIGSVLTFTHDRWPEQDDFFAICSFHWARHLTMLARYCETGQPQVDAKVEANEIRKVMAE